jgi:hypothetical protein
MRRGDAIEADFWALAFDSYAPVRAQFFSFCRAVKWVKRLAGVEPASAVPFRVECVPVRSFGKYEPLATVRSRRGQVSHEEDALTRRYFSGLPGKEKTKSKFDGRQFVKVLLVQMGVSQTKQANCVASPCPSGSEPIGTGAENIE